MWRQSNVEAVMGRRRSTAYRPERVVGSTGKMQFEMRDGKPVPIKLAEIDLIDDKEGKPVSACSPS
jgi:hypothetical protein